MPNLLTHAYFSLEVNDKIKDKTTDLKTLKIFSFGPDPYYASNSDLGKIMHRKNIDEFFNNLITYIKENNLKNNEEVKAFLYGLVTHYALDAYVHPYVFYKSGLDRDIHRKTELSIDKYYSEKRNINLETFKIYKYLFEKRKNKNLKKIIDEVVLKTYNYKDAYNLYQKGINRLYYLYKYIRYDKSGIKYKIYNSIDKKRNNKEKIVNMSYHIINEADLNNSHNTWFHPCTKEKSTKSVDDLYSEALTYTVNLINQINEVLNGKDIKISFDKSLITGLNYKENYKIMYYEENL